MTFKLVNYNPTPARTCDAADAAVAEALALPVALAIRSARRKARRVRGRPMQIAYFVARRRGCGFTFRPRTMADVLTAPRASDCNWFVPGTVDPNA